MRLSCEAQSLVGGVSNRKDYATDRFSAGLSVKDEQNLNRSGVRGRKVFALYICVLVLLILALLNFAILLWILSVLKVSYDGLSDIFFRTDGTSFRRILEVSNDLVLGAGQISSGKRMFLDGHHKGVKLDSKTARVSVKPNMISFQSDEGLLVRDFSDRPIFGPGRLNSTLPDGARHLKAQAVDTDRVVGYNNQGLRVYSARGLQMRSSLGNVHVKSRDIRLSSAVQPILLSSEEKLRFSAGSINIDPISLPTILISNTNGSKNRQARDVTSYRLCICGKDTDSPWKLFRILAEFNCDQTIRNPCID